MNEQAKWLRICGNTDRDGCDHLCPYYDDDHCPRGIMYEAADTIERMQNEIDRLHEEAPVRCGECNNKDFCTMKWAGCHDDDWFCGDGKREEEK